MVSRSLVFLTLSLGCWSFVHARPVPVLTYAELFQQADCVLIAHPISTRDARHGDPLVEIPGEGGEDYLTPVVTRFKVLSVVKGDMASKEILIPHYRLDWDKAKSNGILGIGNGPSLVTFAIPKKDDHDFDDIPCARDCILFLKRECDGDFNFVTGQFDPAYSVFSLQPGTADR